jgi:hypothetical protein
MLRCERFFAAPDSTREVLRDAIIVRPLKHTIVNLPMAIASASARYGGAVTMDVSQNDGTLFELKVRSSDQQAAAKRSLCPQKAIIFRKMSERHLHCTALRWSSPGLVLADGRA